MPDLDDITLTPNASGDKLVPDVWTLTVEQRDQARGHAVRLEQENAELRRVIEQAKGLHHVTHEPDGLPLCLTCGDGTGSEDWPCRTLRTLDGDA